MNTSPSLRIIVALCFVLGVATASYAQATRTWVSGVGDDANPCSRTAPCKTFAGTIPKTANGGEIDTLDPGGFGNVTITKSITIDGAGGGLSGITAAGSSAITINDGVGISVVTLRNLTIFAPLSSLSAHGINFLSGKTLVVENCRIAGFTTAGIRVSLSVAGGNLTVINSTIENNPGDGISLTTSTGQIVTMIENTRIVHNGSDGIEANTHARIGVQNSIITRNTSAGVKIIGADSIVNMNNTFVSFSSVGLQSFAGSAINVSNSTIAQNATGLSANGGTLASFQGNGVFSNTVNGAFTSTTNQQ